MWLIKTIFILFALWQTAWAFSSVCTSTGWSCMDCKTRKYCFGSSFWSSKACASNTPYCNPSTNKCQSGIPKPCETEKFKCSKPGEYPNLENCSQYLACPETNATHTVETCEENHVFNQKFAKCVIKVSPDDCQTIKCLENQVYPNKNDMHTYYVCSNRVPVVRICEEGFVFNQSTKKCENLCLNPNELIPNPKNCSTFYSCNENLEVSLQSCPKATGYSPVHSKCLPSYSLLCNENVMIINSIEKMSEKLKYLVGKVQDVLSNENRTYLSFFVDLGMNPKRAADYAMFFSYIVEHKIIPDSFVNYVLPCFSEAVRPVIRTIFNMVNSVLEKFYVNE